jgi:hypothetical protein
MFIITDHFLQYLRIYVLKHWNRYKHHNFLLFLIGFFHLFSACQNNSEITVYVLCGIIRIRHTLNWNSSSDVALTHCGDNFVITKQYLALIEIHFLVIITEMSRRYHPANEAIAYHGSTILLARTLWSWVRIPIRAWMFGVYMCLFCVYAVMCLGRRLGTIWSFVQGVLPTVNKSGDRKVARARKGCRAIQKLRRLLWHPSVQTMFVHFSNVS